MIKGMILAAGRGTRMENLTDYLPKPLIPVANRPVMEYGVECLQRLGISTIAANVCYRKTDIMQHFADIYEQITIHWSEEEEAIGTAGGVKKMQHLLGDDTVVIIAGDALLDVDLRDLLAKHRENKALATIATFEVSDTSQYGVVLTDEAQRIVIFQEKPSAEEAISQHANTGIYIFEPEIFDFIPPNTFYDFAMDVFPVILELGLPFYAYPVTGYWTDIGNPQAYLQANMDFLTGSVKVNGRGQIFDTSFIGGNSTVAGSWLKRCMLGNNIHLPTGCEMEDCIIWDNTSLEEPIKLKSAIITPNKIVKLAKTAESCTVSIDKD